MTLEEAIKHAEEVAEEKEIDIENQDPLFPNNIEECKKCAEEHRQLAEWLKELKQLREQTRWISVSERLPDIHDYCMKYLVTDCHRHIHTSLFIESRGKGWWSHEDVTAWMPLPEPYKAESEEV